MKFAAIILAAGLSRRMGVLKPLLPVGEVPAVLRASGIMNAAGISDLFVVTGHLHKQIESVFLRPDAPEARSDAPEARIIHNESYQSGMFSSIVAGARGLPAGYDGFFLLPADCCAVSANTLTLLIAKFSETNGEYVVRPKLGELRGHPPLIPAKFRDALLSYDGEDGMRGFLNSCPFTLIYPDDPGVLLDMDTPEDYTQLLAYLGFPTYPNAAECTRLMAKYGTPHHVIEHGEQVAALAVKLAELVERRGAVLDVRLLESACLLHDILRTEPEHAQAGMRLLLRKGYPKAAMLVGAHMDGQSVEVEEIDESELLFLADKLCRRGRHVTVEETLSALTARFTGDPEALRQATSRLGRAGLVMDILRERYGVDYKDIF